MKWKGRRRSSNVRDVSEPLGMIRQATDLLLSSKGEVARGGSASKLSIGKKSREGMRKQTRPPAPPKKYQKAHERAQRELERRRKASENRKGK